MTNNLIGNITTIGKLIAMIIAGWFIGICVSQGINLPVDQETLSEIIFATLLLIWGIIDAKYPNTFTILKNNTTTPTTEEIIIPDIDPAGEYDDN